MKNITQETLKKELLKIQGAVKVHTEIVNDYNKEMQQISVKKESQLVELARLNGEQRAISRLLSTFGGNEK